MQQNTGVLDQNRAGQTEPGSSVSTVSHTAPVTQQHPVSYSSVVSGRSTGSQAASTTPQHYQNPVITPSQHNPQSSTVPSQLNLQSAVIQPSGLNNPQPAMMQPSQLNNPQSVMIPQPNIASQQPNFQSGASPQSNTPLALQGSQPAPQPISVLNNISGTASAPQQLAPTAPSGNLMGQYELTQLTRKQLDEYRVKSAASGHLSVPAHVRSSHPPNPASSSRSEEEPSPMDTSN